MSDFLRFTSVISAGLLLVFVVHLGTLQYLELTLFENRLPIAYLVNWILAILILFVMLHPPKRFKENLGFLFMFGSLLKFIFFFSFFYPYFLEDGIISRVEFFAFFAPYAACLVLETKLLINKLSE